MNGRQATLLVSDEFMVSLSGKITVLGLYTGDISILTNPAVVPQLVCLFIVETPIDEPFESLSVEVTIPGEAQPRRMPFAVARPTAIPPGRTKLTNRLPFALQNLRLGPGQIKARVIHEKGEIEVGGPWVVLSEPPQAPAA